MIFRYSILSIFRSWGKSFLFTLLIFSLTLALALSVSVWASVAQFLNDCEDYYTTIGLVEYMGTNYPADTVYDESMDRALASFDPSEISNNQATLLWETPARSFGYIDGFWRTDTFMPDRMLSVLVVGNVFYEEENGVYSAIVMKSLYSEKSKDDTIVLIDSNFGTFEQGHYYLVFGEIYYAYSPLLHLRIAPFNNAIAAAEGVEVPRLLDITAEENEGEFYILPEDSILMKIAQTLPVTNNSLLVSGTDDLMSLLPFQQQELYIVAGRVFNEDEYTNGSRVIVISELMAERLRAGVGDSINLSVAVSDQAGFYNSYWVDTGYSYSDDFTIVGIMNTVMDKSWYVYVPRSTGVPSSVFPIGYTVGQAVIRNEEAANFYTQIETSLKDRFHLTIYDQGYSAVATPFQIILRIAKIVTAVCGLVELAVLIFFGFLFVYRQRETSETMLMLGTGRIRVIAYFLFSSGLISLFAAAAGGVVGYHLHDRILKLVARAAEKNVLIDSRFSNGNLSFLRTLEFAPHLDWQLFFYTAAIVFLLAILSCLVFTVSTFLHSRPSRQKLLGPQKERKTSHLNGGSIKYALLSIWRGGSRSLVVPLLALTVVFFFGQLSTTYQRYQEQLNSIYTNTQIEGYYTDINGKQIGGQVLDAYDVNHLYHTGLLNSLSISIGKPYFYLGISKLADGTEMDTPPLYVPKNAFVFESLEATILRGPDLTATNDIYASPEFYYANEIEMTFLEGYDETVLSVAADDDKVNSCIIPTSLMEEQGLALGDTLRVAIDEVITSTENKERIFRHFDLRVVGSYEKQGTDNTIYAPIAILFDTGLIWEDGQIAVGAPLETFSTGYLISPEDKETLHSTTLNSATFTLSDSQEIINFKDYLTDYGYSQVNRVSKVREFIVLQDAAFNNSVASIKQQIRYINILYPFLYALVGIIALVVSYLLVVSRKREFATMRGLGSPRTHTFFSFFYEQAFLCLFGTAAGSLIWRVISGLPTALHFSLITGFLFCYFLGSAISIKIMNQASVLDILLDRD